MNNKFTYHKLTAIAVIFVLAIGGYSFGFIQSADAATSDITAVRILGNTCTAGASCNGYVAEIDIEGLATGGSYDFGFSAATPGSQVDGSAKLKFTVTSPGYDVNGNATTNTRAVYGTRPLRNPYPLQSTADETAAAGYVTVRVVLSEYIYANDIVTADIGSGFYTASSTSNDAVSNQTVVNNSTLAYPKPVGRWAWVPYERVTTDFTIESTIFHRFSQNGKPLAAVKYTCTDEHSNIVTQTVNNMTVSTREDSANTGNKVLVYAATMPVAGFTQGDVISCNFIAYPWVGNATSLLNSDLVANGGDGFAQPDDRLGPFNVLNDKGGTYGAPCAVVASTGQASAAATWVFASCAAAESAYAVDNTQAYADIGYASRSIKAYNNTNHGHDDPGGGTIELVAQNYSTPGTASTTTLGAQDTWLTVQPASNVPCQTPVINANVNDELMAQKIKYSCISTMTTTGNTFKGAVGYTDLLWLDRMKLNSTAPDWSRYWLEAFATRNTVDALSTNGFTSFSSVRSPWGLIRGNTYTPLLTATAKPLNAEFYNVLGNKNLKTLSRYDNLNGRHISDNALWAFNSTFNDDNNDINFALSSDTHTTFSSGVAFVQNVIESVNAAGVSPNIGIENMGGTDNINNLIAWHNTSRGQRSNVAYATDADHCSSALPLLTNWTWKYNLESNNNRVTDIRDDHGCPFDGARTGNWAMNFMVSGAGNALAVGSGPSWSQPEYWGLYSMGVPTTAGFVSDKSSTTYGGAGGGNGDYRLMANSTFRNVIPVGQAVLPYDIAGNTRYNNGMGAIGAYEFEVTSSKAITSFDFNGLNPVVIGDVNEASHTIVLTVPNGTDITALAPTIAITGASISPQTGVQRNFSSPVTYTVTATDSSTQNYTVTVVVASGDNTPPSVPSNFRTTGSSYTSISLAWNASTDNVGVTGYRVTRNGTQVYSGMGLSFTDTGLIGGTSYAYSVAAIDAASNISTAATLSTSSMAYKSADLNSDTKVDVFDLSIFLSKWNTSDATSDINNDGIVNIFDLSILLSQWGS